jgi:hypothetical protein
MRCRTTSAVLLSLVFLWSQPGLLAAEPDRESVRKALTFHASFDGQPDADFARGDKRIYTASNMKRSDAKPGLHRADVEIAKGKGTRVLLSKFHR